MPKIFKGNVYYVYHHVDPTNDELLYIGMGSGSRAWSCETSRDKMYYGRRAPEHAERLTALMQVGYVPSDWVIIVARSLDRSAAMRLEQDQIRQCKPLFNKPAGKKIMKWDDEMLKRAVELRQSQESYSNIADKLGLSTMTVYRALNNQTKNIGDINVV